MTQRGEYRRSVYDALGYLNAWDPASPDTFYAQNLPRGPMTDGAIAATGIMTSVPISLASGDVITNISFRTGATAGGTMTNWWVALYDDSATPALMAQCADQTSGAIAANTTITKALSAAQTIRRTGIYQVAIMVAATTIPTLLGWTVWPSGVVTGDGQLARSSGSGLTTTAPATIATTTERTHVPRFVLT